MSARLRMAALAAAGAFGLACATATGPAPPTGAFQTQRVAGGYLDVENIRECADHLDAAATQAREIALRTTLNDFGGDRIDADIRADLFARTEQLTEPIAVYNTKRQGGRVCPVYTVRVDVDAIETRIRAAHARIQAQVMPTLGVAVSVCSLPARHEAERGRLAAALNDQLKEQFFELGFETEMSRATLERMTRAECDDLAVRDAFLRDQLRATNYLVYGRAEIGEHELRARDAGGYHADAHLSLRFLSVSDGVEVVSTLDATGGGRSELASMRQALERAADRIARAEASHQIVEHWQRKLTEGFVYDVLFCQLEGPPDWVPVVRDALAEQGRYVGNGMNVVVAGAPRRTWRFRADPGAFVRGPDFIFFLEDLQRRRGEGVPGLPEVAVGPRVLDGRVFTLFGDDLELCFDASPRRRIE